MDKNKKVCMYVWNHFTNDARVLRECTALSENGYEVDLICIHDPMDKEMPYVEQRNDNFRVLRVRRYPFILTFLQTIRRNKALAALSLLIWLVTAFFMPTVVLPLTLFAAILLKTKCRTIVVRGSIIARMILQGIKKDYDIYHSNDLNTLPQGYICAKWRMKKKTLVYDSHEVQTSRTGYDSGLYGKMEQFLIKRIDSMIVENNTRAKYNEDLYGFYPNVLHNYPFKQEDKPLEKINLHEMLNLPENEKILLYQGGIQVGRGLDKLIQAVPSFKEGTVVLIGDGKIKPQLVKMVEEAGLQDKVKFLPKVPLEDLPRYTANAYLGFQILNNVCFNHYSASSNKLFEYMMAGVPVVACDFPEIKRVVAGEQTGVIVDSHDPEDIARGVNELLQDPALRDKFSKNSMKARHKYNWDEESKVLLDIYNVFG